MPCNPSSLEQPLVPKDTIAYFIPETSFGVTPDDEPIKRFGIIDSCEPKYSPFIGFRKGLGQQVPYIGYTQSLIPSYPIKYFWYGDGWKDLINMSISKPFAIGSGLVQRFPEYGRFPQRDLPSFSIVTERQIKYNNFVGILSNGCMIGSHAINFDFTTNEQISSELQISNQYHQTTIAGTRAGAWDFGQGTSYDPIQDVDLSDLVVPCDAPEEDAIFSKMVSIKVATEVCLTDAIDIDAAPVGGKITITDGLMMFYIKDTLDTNINSNGIVKLHDENHNAKTIADVVGEVDGQGDWEVSVAAVGTYAAHLLKNQYKGCVSAGDSLSMAFQYDAEGSVDHGIGMPDPTPINSFLHLESAKIDIGNMLGNTAGRVKVLGDTKVIGTINCILFKTGIDFSVSITKKLQSEENWYMKYQQGTTLPIVRFEIQDGDGLWNFITLTNVKISDATRQQGNDGPMDNSMILIPTMGDTSINTLMHGLNQ